jgi:hypothetical protein
VHNSSAVAGFPETIGVITARRGSTAVCGGAASSGPIERNPFRVGETVRRRTLIAAVGAMMAPAWGVDPLSTAATAPSQPTGIALPPLPPPETRRFDVSLGEYNQGARLAEVSYRLEHGDGRYRIDTMAQATGVVALVYSGQLTQTSEGIIGPAGLVPERYVEKRGRRPERSLRFDHGRGRMIGNGEPPEVALPVGTQDRLSLGYQLGLIARADRRATKAGYNLLLPLASLKRVDIAAIKCGGETLLRVRGELFRTIKYEIRNERHADDRIDIWLGPDQSMLPVRIRFEEGDGKVIDQVLAPRRS